MQTHLICQLAAVACRLARHAMLDAWVAVSCSVRAVRLASTVSKQPGFVHVSEVLQQLLVTLRQQLVSKGAAGNVH